MASCDDDFSLLSHHQYNHRETHLSDTVFVNSFESHDFDPDPTSDPNLTNKRKDRDDVSDTGTTAVSIYKKSKSPAKSPGNSGGDYRKDREEWSDTAIDCLLDAYTEKYSQLNRGNLRGRDWDEVAKIVSERCLNQSKSVEQCKNKVDNLKKRYKLEKHRMNSAVAGVGVGVGVSVSVSISHWPWFTKMEAIVGNSPSSKAVEVSDEEKIGGVVAGRQHKRYATGTPGSLGQTNIVKCKAVPNVKWQRVVFKISGAALAGNGPRNVDPKVVLLIAREVAFVNRLGVQVAIVVGGRNFPCGDAWSNETGVDRCVTYQIGMMATMMNSVYIQSALEKLGVQTRVQTSISCPEFGESYNRQRAIRHLEKGRVVIFGGVGGGSGNPLVSTDAMAALRASEIKAQAVIKGGNADGIHDCSTRSDDTTFEHISFTEAASRSQTSLDMMVLTLCEENGIPVVVFNLHELNNISRALRGEQIGTLIDQTGPIS